jgi:hypothetical protein
MDADSFDNGDGPTRRGSEEDDESGRAPSTPQDQRLGRALKRFKTIMEHAAEREELLQRVEEEYSKMRGEASGTGEGRDFAPMLRSETEGDPNAWPRRLPPDFLNRVWSHVIEEGVGSQPLESSVFDVELLASGLPPDSTLPPDPRLREVERQMALLRRPDGAYVVERPGDLDVLLPGPEWGTDIEERPRRKYQALNAERMELLSLQTDEKYQLRRRQGLAGIPELARVLATDNTLWRRWWHRDFPRHVLEYGSSAWAEQWVETPAYLHPPGGPRPPEWILKMQARQGLSDAEAGVEAQYAHCAWRRFHAWTLFFERRCYRLIMDIAETQASEYTVRRPRYTPHGVYFVEPLIPDEWMLQSAEEKSMSDPGEGYVAFARYANEGDNNDDVDRAVDLDRVALLLPETAMRGEANDSLLSAGVLAYIALSHAGRGIDQETLDGPCKEFASIRVTSPSSRVAWTYNFLNDSTTELIDPRDYGQRQDRYRNMLLSYILWSMVTAQRRERQGPPYPLAETLVAVQERAAALGLPVREHLMGPLEQATLLGLYRPSGREAEDVEGSWAFLNLLPVVPMRGVHGSTNRITGHGGVRFVGTQAKNLTV